MNEFTFASNYFQISTWVHYIELLSYTTYFIWDQYSLHFPPEFLIGLN